MSNCNCHRQPCICQTCPPFPPTPGPAGPQGPAGIGSNIETGAFTQLAIFGSGSKTYSTVNQVKLVFFNALNGIVGSDGRANISMNNCTHSAATNKLYTPDQSNCINVVDNNGNGFTAILTTINPTSFVLNWTIVGSGLDVIVQWHAITG